MSYLVNPILINTSRDLLVLLLVGAATCWSAASTCTAQTVNDQYGLAAGHYARGEYAEAITAFQSIVQHYPNTELAAVSHFFLAESYVQEKDYAKAFPEYQEFLILMPGHKYSARAQFRMGEAAYRQDNVPQAVTLLEAFARAYPQHPLHEFCLPYLGQVRLKRNEPQLAQRAFERALQWFPKGEMSYQCRIGLADALLAQGAVDEAIRFYDFLKTQKNNPFVGEAALALGKIWFQRNDMAKARSNLEYAVEKLSSNPKRFESQYWLARCDIEVGQFSSAVNIIQLIADKEMPRDLKASVLFDGAIGAFKADQPERAEAWLSELQQDWPDTRWAESALIIQIDIAFSQQDWEGALQLVEEFGDQYPDSTERYEVREISGRVYYEQANYEKTIETFQDLLMESDAEDVRISQADRNVWNYFIGLGLVGKKEYSKAIGVLEGVALKQADAELTSALAIARATALVGLGRSSDSVVHLQTYLKLQPQGSHALRARADLAVALVADGKWGAAGLVVEELVDKHPLQDITWNTVSYMAETAYQKNKWDAARQWFTLLSENAGANDYRIVGVSGLFWVAANTDRPHLCGALFERLRENYPESEATCEAAMERAKYLEESGEFLQSVEMYRFVHERFVSSPLAPVAVIRHGYNLQRAGGSDNLAAARKLLSAYVDDVENQARSDEAIYMLAWVCQDLELTTESIAWFQLLVEKHQSSPFWADAAYRVALVMMQREKYTVAQDLLTELFQRDLSDSVASSALYLQGQLSAKLNDWERVTESMQKLVKLTGDQQMSVKAKYWLAESYYRNQKYEKANTAFGELVESEGLLNASLKPWIRLRKAQCLVHLEAWNEVLDMAKRCRNNYPDFEAVYEFDFLQGRGLAALGKLQDARAAYERVINSDLGGTTETAAIAQWRIGETYFHQEDYKQAIDAYYRVDSLFSYEKWRAAALIQAGKCQEQLGNWKHAVKLYQQLIRQFPGSEFRTTAENRLRAAARQAKVENPNSSR